MGRMPDSRILTATFYAELQSGSRSRGRPLLRYKDNIKVKMKSTGIDPKTWENLAMTRLKWRSACLTGVQRFEDADARLDNATEKCRRRKDSTAKSRVFAHEDSQ